MNKTTSRPLIVSAIIVLVALVGIFTYKFRSIDLPQQVKVTALLPLTGPAAVFGQDEKLGIELALETQKTAPIPIAINFEDTQGKPDITVSALRKNYDLSGSRIYIASTTGPALAVLPILKGSSDPTITFVIATLSGITKDYPSAFRIYPSVDEEIRVLSSYAKEANFRRIAVYCLRNQAGEDAIRKLGEEVAVFGGAVVFSDTFPASEKDFRQVLLKVKEAKPDALLITGYTTHYADILRQMLEGNIRIPVLAGIGMPLGGLEKQFPADFISQVIFPASQLNFEPNNPRVKAFAAMVKSRGKVANFEIAYAYDSTRLLLAAVEKAGSTDPKLIANAIKGLMPYEGINGTIKLDENRDARLGLKASHYGPNGIEPAVLAKP